MKNKKIISFSLWGDNETYNVGAIRNAGLALDFYPDFECWFYIHKESVPSSTLNQLSEFKNTKLIFKDGDLSDLSVKPMTWRFEAIDSPDVDLIISRDTDSRILYREQVAVNEWINSNRKFHIMIDHPHHNFNILGGMFGTKKIQGINWTQLISDFPRNSDRNYDQNFLKDIIYPNIKNDVLIHSNFYSYEGEVTTPFSIPYDSEYHFIGEYIYADETRSPNHVLELIKSLS
jgi:hypothetical protein